MKDVVFAISCGSEQTHRDPQISEWGKPGRKVITSEYIGLQSERGELKHLSSYREKKSTEIPKVVASEMGRAANDNFILEQLGNADHRG